MSAFVFSYHINVLKLKNTLITATNCLNFSRRDVVNMIATSIATEWEFHISKEHDYHRKDQFMGRL